MHPILPLFDTHCTILFDCFHFRRQTPAAMPCHHSAEGHFGKDACHDKTPLADCRNRGQQDQFASLALASGSKGPASGRSASSDACATAVENSHGPLIADQALADVRNAA